MVDSGRRGRQARQVLRLALALRELQQLLEHLNLLTRNDAHQS